jgi:ribosomal protein L24E
MSTSESLCPYCGKENVEEKGPKCFFCGMVLGDNYLMFIDADNKVSNLCSTSCVDLLEESIKTDDHEGVEEEEGYNLMGNVCPMCGLKTSTSPTEAKSVCKLCGMLIAHESPKYVIRGNSTYLNFCCSRCLKIFNATRGLDFDKMPI